MISVSLEKRVENVVVNLQKRTTKQLKDVNLNLCLDVSGSTYSEYRSNSAGESSISILLERICAISKVVDDDGILNFYLFDTSSYPQKPIVVEKDYQNLTTIVNKIYHNTSYWSATNFAPVLSEMYNDLITNGGATVNNFKSSFLSFFGFGKKKQPELPKENVTKQLILFITDGENGDKSQTNSIIEKYKACPNVFIQFIDVGHTSAYLRALADSSANIGYSTFISFTHPDDDVVLSGLLTDKLLNYFAV